MTKGAKKHSVLSFIGLISLDWLENVGGVQTYSSYSSLARVPRG